MTNFIVESATDTGSNVKYLSCKGGQHWVTDANEASRFLTSELAEQLADDWQDFYAMRGYGRLTNIVEVNQS